MPGLPRAAPIGDKLTLMLLAIHTCLAWWRRRVFLIALVVLGAAGAAEAQLLPRHLDPNARQAAQGLPTLPALRFLTTADYPPFNYRDPNGALVGYNVDLAEAICTELKTICTLQAWPWDQVADALADNQGDALIGGLALDAKTAERFDFSPVYLRFPGRFVVPQSEAKGFRPEALAGKTIAVRAGSRHADFVARYLPGSEMFAADTEFAALDRVRSGEADAYFGDALRASFWLGQNPLCCAFAGGAYFRPDYFGRGLAIAIGPGRDAVSMAIDVALARIAKSGKLDELYLRWFPVGFY
jgi:polar amino acid transport system substrate-binding protein